MTLTIRCGDGATEPMLPRLLILQELSTRHSAPQAYFLAESTSRDTLQPLVTPITIYQPFQELEKISMLMN